MSYIFLARCVGFLNRQKSSKQKGCMDNLIYFHTHLLKGILNY